MRLVVLGSSFDSVGGSLQGRPVLNLIPEPFKHELRILDVTPFHTAEGVPDSTHKLDDGFVVQSIELNVEQVEDGRTSGSTPVAPPTDGNHGNENSSLRIDVRGLALFVIVKEVKPEFRIVQELILTKQGSKQAVQESETVGIPVELRTDRFAMTDGVKANANPLGQNARGGHVEGSKHGDELSEPRYVGGSTLEQRGQLDFLGEIFIIIDL